MKSFLLKYYSYGFLVLLCVFYIFKTLNFPVHDFANYYFGGKFLANDNFNSTIYFPYHFNKLIANLGHQNIFVSYAPNTPFLAALFSPFSLISVANAKIIFNIISSILFVFSIYKLSDFYKINTNYLLLIPILFFIPIKNNLLFGQVYFVLFFLLSQGLIAYENQQFKKMAFYLSFSIFLKVFPILFILIFVLKKQFKPLFYTIGICGLFFGISVLFTGFDIWFFYIQKVLPKASNGEIASAYVDNYQSVFMFIKRLLVFEETQNPKAIFNNPILFSGLILGFKFLLLAIGFYATKKIKNTILVFSYWILTSILISPYGSTYTFILLIFPFLALSKMTIPLIKKVFFLVLLFLINNFPLSIFIQNQFPFSYFRLLFLFFFFILFVVLFYKNVNWKIVSFCVTISILFVCFFNKNKTTNTSYFLNKNAPILVYDYAIQNNQITYFYWNENGENSKTFSFNYKNIENLKIKESQVFYKNKQITFDKDNKLKPILIDGNIIVYLSDLDRGIGFYALRKLQLW